MSEKNPRSPVNGMIEWEAGRSSGSRIMGHPLALSLSNGDAPGPLEFYGSSLAGEIVAGTGPVATWVLPRRPAEQRRDDEPLTLGDVVEAVMQCSVDSREASVVIEDLLANGRIRLTGERVPVDACEPIEGPMSGMLPGDDRRRARKPSTFPSLATAFARPGCRAAGGGATSPPGAVPVGARPGRVAPGAK